MKSDEAAKSDYDSPWKEMLEIFFEQSLKFFFPIAYNGIDWSEKYEFLDKELQKVVRDAETRRRHVDKLIKVYRKDGKETWILVHVEVQCQFEQDFAERMYRYNCRLFDRYNRKIASLAILADDRKNWRPNSFCYEIWGSKASLEFPVVKLLDYKKQWRELEQNPNPFAIITMAHLKAMATHHKPEDRYQAKFAIIKMLYNRSYTKKQIQELFVL